MSKHAVSALVLVAILFAGVVGVVTIASAETDHEFSDTLDSTFAATIDPLQYVAVAIGMVAILGFIAVVVNR